MDLAPMVFRGFEWLLFQSQFFVRPEYPCETGDDDKKQIRWQRRSSSRAREPFLIIQYQISGKIAATQVAVQHRQAHYFQHATTQNAYFTKSFFVDQQRWLHQVYTSMLLPDRLWRGFLISPPDALRFITRFW
jgi:hypothetical protein